MLRITAEENGSRTTLRLEGRLRGDWVQELERCWTNAMKDGPQMLFSVDLNNLDSVNEPGAALLRRMASSGVKLMSDRNLLMSALVEEIMRSAMHAPKVSKCSPT
jgi:hypothetical protein